jgi:hypothetical protein
VVDIFDEVDEDLRAERAANLLKRYAWLIVAVGLAIIAAAIGWQFWTRWQANRDLAAAQLYVTAQTEADAATNQPAVAASPARAAAIAALDQQIASAPDGYRTLGRLRAASLTAAQHQLDHGDPAQLEARLKPLATPGNPWSALAKEQLALLDLRQGKSAEAKTTLHALSVDVTAPNGVRQRASALLTGLGDAPGE